MSDMWSAAAAVPVWTRPQAATGFRARAADAGPHSFSPWSEPRAPEPDAPASQAQAPTIDIERLRADAFAAGFEEGRSTVAMEIAAERAAVNRLVASLESLQPECPQALAALLSDTVKRLVAGIVGQVAIDDAMLLARTQAAAAFISEECAPARLRLHPADVARLAGADLSVELVADPAIKPGMIVTETATGWIEDGPQVRLEKLRQSLDRLGSAA